MELVRHGDPVVVEVEIAAADPWLPRRMIAHESVAEVIDRFEVDREEIRWLMVQQPNGGGLYAHTFGQGPQEQRQALVVILG